MSLDLRGPAVLETRALGPDLARGLMLAFIALANSHYFLSGSSVLGGYPQDGSRTDAVVTWLISTFVDGRAFPMFGLLFGYGVARIALRQEGLGPRVVRRLLWRRALVLVVVGFAHALLLYVGDILAAYGVLLVVGAWLVRWRDRWLLLLALVFFVLAALPGHGSLAISSDQPDSSMLPPDPLTMLVTRAQVAPVIALLGPLGFVCPFAIGMWAGRRRILEEPERYRGMLRTVAWLGVGLAGLGAQPVSLVVSGVLPPPGRVTLGLLGPLHDTTGMLGGLGYAALISLLALRPRGRPPAPFVSAVAAVGQRSTTCYPAQSVVWTRTFTPFLLDLSYTLTVASTALLAVATWLLTVLLADWMRRTGRRGPFEVLTRRFTYGWPTRARTEPSCSPGHR